MQNTNLLSAMIEKTWNVHHIETHLALRFLYSRLNWVNNIQPNLYEQNRSHGHWGHNLGKIYSKSFVFSWAIAYLMVNHLSIEKYFIGCVLVFNFWGKCDTISLLWTTLVTAAVFDSINFTKFSLPILGLPKLWKRTFKFENFKAN